MKLLLLAGALVLTGCEVVDTGNRGLRIEFGKVIDQPLTEGLYFYNPFTASIKEISVREEKLEGKEESFTKDTQHVTVSYALTYYPDPAKIGDIYRQFGELWTDKIIKPALQGALKDSIGRYIADDLVGKREEVKTAIFKELVDSLKTRNVVLTRIDLTNLDFDDAYEKAVEDKVVAVQRAIEEQNKTVQIKEQAAQTVFTAKASAEAMRLQSQALSENKNLVEYEAVKKWNGQLPQYMLGNSTLPFLHLDKK